MHWRRKWQPTPVSLPGESQGRGSLVGCRLWGRTESDTTEATQQQQQQRSFPSSLLSYDLAVCSVTSVTSDSLRPHRRQPTRLPRPWDSPGKDTGVGCHFLLQCMKMKSEREVSQSCLTLRDPMDCSLPGSSTHGIFQARVLEWGAIAFSEIDF